MINPQPVHTPKSPYRNETGSSHRPTVMSSPLTPPAGTPSPRKPKERFRWKRTIGLAVLALIAGTSTYAFAQYRNLKANIIQEHQGTNSQILSYDGTSKNKLDATKFTQSGDGRFNMVIVGVGGENHPGGSLTDSIQVLSVDTINSTLTFTSVPRDLYVNYKNFGRTKINAVYEYAEQKKAGDGALAVREMVGQVLGINISNFAILDFTGIKQIVDAIGGIEVNVPKALDDPLYPATDMIHYDPLYVKSGPQTMNGEMALKYSRSRETTTDFDRSMRQQIVIGAIKKKSLSLGVLTSPTKVTNIITALGNHFKTDLQIDNSRQLINIYQKITPENTKGYTLDTSTALGLLSSVSSPAYYAFPTIGYDKYDDIAQWFSKNSPDPLITKEAPSITVYNSGKASTKQMTDLVQKLKDYGYTVTLSTDTPPTKTSATQIVTNNPSKKPISFNYLGTLFKTTTTQGNIFSNATTDYELVYVPTVTASSIPKVTAKQTPTPSPTDTTQPTGQP
jgi:LCP family protein required for cell wall assembly